MLLLRTVYVQSDTLENSGNVDEKKNLRRIFRSKTYHNLINVAWLFDGKTHVFVLKSVVVCGTDPHKRLCDLHQYKCVCVNEIYNLRAEKLTVTLF